MKIAIPLVFILSGLLFLLVATLLFPSIMQYLKELRSGIQDFPSWWNIVTVGAIVRVIFGLVGAFLTIFGTVLLVIRNRIDLF